MPDSLRQRVPADIVLENAPPGTVEQRTQAHLAQLRNVLGIGLVEYDSTYAQVKAYLERPGRPADQQKWLQDKAAHLMYGYEQAHDKVTWGAWDDILRDRPQVIVRTEYVTPPKQPFLKRIIGG